MSPKKNGASLGIEPRSLAFVICPKQVSYLWTIRPLEKHTKLLTTSDKTRRLTGHNKCRERIHLPVHTFSTAIDMFSSLSCNVFPSDIPSPLDTLADEDPLVPLDFDELLDIAREFEFTRTITHIWPCEEPDTCLETGLEDIVAAIVPAPDPEESLLPLPSPLLSMPLDPVPFQEVGLHRLVPVHPALDEHASIPEDAMSLPKDDDQVRADAEYATTSMLLGWSPPDGSPFLDLDDSLMQSQSVNDMWISPWLATFLAPPCIQPPRNINQPSATAHAIGDVPQQAPATHPKAPPVSRSTRKTDDDPTRNTVPLVSLPPQRAILQPVRGESAPQANANVPSKPVMPPNAKTPKSRAHPSSTSATGGISSATYAKPPRGGVPPHIARTVTKANILRIEKERKVMRDAFSSISVGERKKPSVLQRTAKTERLCSESGGKKPLHCGEDDEREGRVAKRMKA